MNTKYTIKRKEIEEAIELAEKSEGYLIIITRLSNTRLFHTYIMLNFKREDIIPTLEEHQKLLKKELPASGTENRSIKVEKKLPPRYRKTVDKSTTQQ